ncbi:MAG: prolyl oligopeptidase family protein [imported], putative, partial [uncultured Pseudonocardia sp.]
ARPGAGTGAARHPHRGHGHRGGRHAAAGVAGPARRCGRRRPGPAAAVDPRRPARELERLAVAVEPVADGRAGLGGAAARPGAVHRLRARLRGAGLGRVGRRALHRPDGAHRRRAGPRGRRRVPHRGDGRLLRRLHGELGGGPHRPVRRDRHAREPVVARPVRPHHRRPLVLAAGDDRGDDAGAQPAPPRRRDHHAGAGRPRRQGLPGAGRGGARAVVGPRVGVRRRPRGPAAPVPVLPRREPLDPHARQRGALVRHRARLPRPPRPGPAVGGARPAAV